MACGIKAATFKSVIRYVCRYANAEGFNQFFLLDQLAVAAWAEWRGDLMGSNEQRSPAPSASPSEILGMDAVDLLASLRNGMDSGSKRRAIETLNFVASGLKESLGGELRP